MAKVMHWIAPLSTQTEGRSMQNTGTQKMILAKAVRSA